MMQRGRIAGLDVIKSLGLYLVVLYHLVWRYVPDVLGGGAKAYGVYFFTTFLSCCVPLFMMSSGALSLTRPVDLKRNGLRCAHLVVVFLVWAAVELPIVLLLRGERATVLQGIEMVRNLHYGYVQHLWYLPTYLFLLLILPMLRSLREGSRRVYVYGAALLAVFTFGNTLLNDIEYLIRYITGNLGYAETRQFFWYVNFFTFRYWYAPVYLVLGAELLDRREALSRYRGSALAVILLCMTALTVIGIARSHVQEYHYDPVCYNYGDPFTMALTVAAEALLLPLEPAGLLRRATESLSKCSLGIYLIHWLLVEAMRRFLPGFITRIVFAPLTALAVLGISWSITWIGMRIPGVKWLFTAASPLQDRTRAR